MEWTSGLSWLAALAAAARPTASEDADGGDMGTAFGLDASFGPIEGDARPAFEASGASLPWEHRLTRRSGL